jgi:hypothetical protein
MNLKNIIAKIAVKKVAGEILPMDGVKPKLGKKAKAAALLGTIATVAAAGAQFLGG